MSSHCRHLADLAFGAFGHQASKYRGDSEMLVRLLFEQPGTVTSVVWEKPMGIVGRFEPPPVLCVAAMAARWPIEFQGFPH